VCINVALSLMMPAAHMLLAPLPSYCYILQPSFPAAAVPCVHASRRSASFSCANPTPAAAPSANASYCAVLCCRSDKLAALPARTALPTGN
jgi:hypothetical protein